MIHSPYHDPYSRNSNLVHILRGVCSVYFLQTPEQPPQVCFPIVLEKSRWPRYFLFLFHDSTHLDGTGPSRGKRERGGAHPMSPKREPGQESSRGVEWDQNDLRGRGPKTRDFRGRVYVETQTRGRDREHFDYSPRRTTGEGFVGLCTGPVSIGTVTELPTVTHGQDLTREGEEGPMRRPEFLSL